MNYYIEFFPSLTMNSYPYINHLVVYFKYTVDKTFKPQQYSKDGWSYPAFTIQDVTK